jgi:antitoxin component of RelBE/YafQ-DinJ toxin-antitoxin module
MFTLVSANLSTVVVSVRVRREVKEELERAGVDISEAVRRYLEELAWKLKIERKLKEWNQLLKNVKPSERGFAARSVREDRDSR